MNRVRLALLAILLLPILLSACASLSGGAKKVVITETGCTNLKFLRMKVGQETRIILDNTTYRETQDGMSLVMTRFPLTITGETPPNTTFGPNFTSITLKTNPGEKTEVRVKASATGEFEATCNVAVKQTSSNQIIRTPITFQITAD